MVNLVSPGGASQFQIHGQCGLVAVNQEMHDE